MSEITIKICNYLEKQGWDANKINAWLVEPDPFLNWKSPQDFISASLENELWNLISEGINRYDQILPNPQRLPEPIQFEEALKLLPNKKRLHVIRVIEGKLVGFYFSRSVVLTILRENKINIGNSFAQEINHELVIKDNCGELFIGTKKKRI